MKSLASKNKFATFVMLLHYTSALIYIILGLLTIILFPFSFIWFWRLEGLFVDENFNNIIVNISLLSFIPICVGIAYYIRYELKLLSKKSISNDLQKYIETYLKMPLRSKIFQTFLTLTIYFGLTLMFWIFLNTGFAGILLFF